MGKKGNWFSSIKKIFIPSSKEKLVNELDKKNTTSKKKKWGLGKFRRGESTSFIPLYREPSSIEKILLDAEKEQRRVQIPVSSSMDQRRVPSASVPLMVAQHNEIVKQNDTTTDNNSSSSNNNNTGSRNINNNINASSSNSNTGGRNNNNTTSTTTNINTTSTTTNNNDTSNIPTNNNYRIPPTVEHHHIAATRIQSVYRGYMARKSFRALKGLVRLQGVVRGQSVKRQTVKAMKYMQLLVKVQTQIQSRRTTFDNQALQHNNVHKNDKDLENNLARWILTQPSERGQEEWDDSVLTKEEMDSRLQRKVDAIIKRERALAYVNSNQLLKATPKSAQAASMETRSGGFPWWWNWIERQLPENNSEIQSTQTKNDRFTQLQSQEIRNDLTPPATTGRPESSNSKRSSFRFENRDSLTPRSLKSPLGSMAKTPDHFTSSRTSLTNKPSTPLRHSKPRSINGSDFPSRDNDSLTSCPPFRVPNYMTPTVSAKAKVRSHSNPKDRLLATPLREQRRLSYPLTPNVGSSRWNEGSVFSNKDSRSVLGHNHLVHSIGNSSVDSTVSLPAHLGRKPFK